MVRFTRWFSALILPLIAALLTVSALAQSPSPASLPAAAPVTPHVPGAWTPSQLRQEAERWYNSGHLSPDTYPSAWHLNRGLQQLGRVRGAMAAPRAASQPVPTAGAWQFAGPMPLNTSGSTDGGVAYQDYGDVSGRVSALALDPADPSGNTLWVGSANGGVWKCTHALSAAACTAMTDTQTSLSSGAIAINPSTGAIYVGTGESDCCSDTVYGQGILTSTTGGSSWTLATSADGGAESFFGLAFTRIIVDPTNPQIIVASAQNAIDAFTGAGTPTALNGTIFNWKGIYRSTDGGSTWSLAFPATTGGDANATDLAYDSGCGCYYAAFAENGLFKSTDQGATWSFVNASPFPSGSNVTDDNQGNTNYSVIKLSVRGGVLYSLIVDSAGDLSAPAPCANGQTSGCDTGVQQSSDGGLTWTPVAIPSANGGNTVMCEQTNFGKDCQGAYDSFLIAPPGGTSLVIGGLDAYATTSVNGMSTTWTDLENAYANVAGVVHGDNHAIVALNSGTWFIGSDGGVWDTQNSGSTWSNLNATLGITQFYIVAADPVTSGVWLAGAQDNGTSKSASGTTAWNRVYLGDGGFTAISTSNTSQYFVEYPGVILRFDDAAVTMKNNPSTVVDTNVTKDAESFYQPYHLLPHDQSTIIMGTCRVWEGPAVTATDGAGWKTISSDVTGGGSGSGTCQQNGDVIRDLEAASTSTNPSVDSVIYAVTTDDHVALSQNANAATPTFTDVSGNGLPTDATRRHPFSSVGINPSNPAVAYVTVEGFGTGHVFKTTNYGGSWTNISGNLPDIPANWVLVDPLNTNDIYVATMAGVFVATDGGVSGEVWQQLGTGLPQADVMQIAISTTSPRMLAAATHGRGLWTIAPLQASNSGSKDFTISASPSTQTVSTGASATITINTTAVNSDTAGITLSCTAPASGCSFSPSSIITGGSSTLTVAASALGTGSNTITISGTDGTNTHTASATVTISSNSGGSGNLWVVAGGGGNAPSTGGGAATSVQLDGGRVVLDTAGNMFLADKNGYIEEVSATTGQLKIIAGCGSNTTCGPLVGTTAASATAAYIQPSALVVAPNGIVYFGDLGSNMSIDKLDPVAGTVQKIAGCGTICGSAPSTTAQAALSAAIVPTGLALLPYGDLLIADSDSNQIELLDFPTGLIVTAAGGGSTKPGATAIPATSAALNRPHGIAVDASGNGYIADYGNGLVEKVTANGSNLTIQAIAGGGSNVVTATPESATTASITPEDLVVDSAGMVYIADNSSSTNNNVVDKLNPATGQIVAIAGCASCFTAPSTTPQPAGTVQIHGVESLTLDNSGNLFLMDHGGLNGAMVEEVAGLAAADPPDFALSASPASQSLAAGATATITIQAASLYGDGKPITLTCTAPAAGCSFSPTTLVPGINASSTLTIAAASLGTGSNTITISGTDGTHTHSVSVAITVTTTPDFSISASTTTGTVSAGQTATYTITITPSGGFSSAVSLSCSGAPSKATCTFTPSSVTPSSGSVTSTLTIATTASSAVSGGSFTAQSATQGKPPSHRSPWPLVSLAAGLLPILLRRVRRDWAKRWLMFGVLAIALSVLSSCSSGGGGGGTSGSSGPSNPGTPAGTSTITITGTSGSLTHTTTVTLTVN